MKSILPCLCAVLCVTHLLTAKDTPEAGYEKRLAAADLTNHPERHPDLATWCKRDFPGKANFHQQAFGEYQFAQLERSFPSQPVVSKYLEMAAKAEALGLEEKAKEYRGKWGVKQFGVASLLRTRVSKPEYERHEAHTDRGRCGSQAAQALQRRV